MTPDERSWIEELLAEDPPPSCRAISRTTGISDWTIRRVKRELDGDPRPMRQPRSRPGRAFEEEASALTGWIVFGGIVAGRRTRDLGRLRAGTTSARETFSLMFLSLEPSYRKETLMKQTTPNKPKSTRGNDRLGDSRELLLRFRTRVRRQSRITRAKVSASTFSRLRSRPGRGYEGQDRWALTVKVADREPEILTPRLQSQPRRAAASCASAPCTRRHDHQNKCAPSSRSARTTSRTVIANG